jgi:hypothetical protein
MLKILGDFCPPIVEICLTYFLLGRVHRQIQIGMKIKIMPFQPG